MLRITRRFGSIWTHFCIIFLSNALMPLLKCQNQNEFMQLFKVLLQKMWLLWPSIICAYIHDFPILCLLHNLLANFKSTTTNSPWWSVLPGRIKAAKSCIPYRCWWQSLMHNHCVPYNIMSDLSLTKYHQFKKRSIGRAQETWERWELGCLDKLVHG